MSYILDALKKSEQQRLATGVPNLYSGQPAAVKTSAPQRNWLVLAAILLAINAAAIAWWLAARHVAPAQPPAPREAAAAPAPQPAPPQPATTTPQPAPGASLAEPAAVAQAEWPAPTAAPEQAPDRPRQDQTAAGRASPPEAVAAAARTVRAPIPPAPRAAASTATATAQATPPADADTIPPAPPRSGIIAYADLPPAVKKALPPLQIGGYVDGDGEAMLVVDDRLVHEGDEFGPGVRVLKVSPDGAVFGFRNYRFRR